VYYRDVRYALPFLLQLILFASPIVYPVRLIPHAWRFLYTVLNPVAASIDSVRRIVAHHRWPDLGALGLSFVWTLFLLVVASAVFKRLERGFSDRA
jgi:lipopolysaccharide transport system permease protein